MDAHRSPTFVISRYSPGNASQPCVDNTFYSTVGTIHNMKVLLGMPPMNVHDAHAPVISACSSTVETSLRLTGRARFRVMWPA